MRGNDASLDFFVLLDDGSSWTLGAELADLRRFIETQPASTAVGLGYMRNGTVDTAAKLNRDHAGAAKAPRLPLGLSSSPWLSLSEFVKRWPAASARREILTVSSGFDPLGGDGIVNPYLDAAIEDAQRAGIIVYATYMPGAGHAGHSYWLQNQGQNHLAELAEATGGEAYMLGFGAPVSIAPYLAEVTERLTHKYRLSLQAGAEEKAGLRSIRLTTEVLNAEIVAASKLYVPAEFGPALRRELRALCRRSYCRCRRRNWNAFNFGGTEVLHNREGMGGRGCRCGRGGSDGFLAARSGDDGDSRPGLFPAASV